MIAVFKNTKVTETTKTKLQTEAPRYNQNPFQVSLQRRWIIRVFFGKSIREFFMIVPSIYKMQNTNTTIIDPTIKKNKTIQYFAAMKLMGIVDAKPVATATANDINSIVNRTVAHLHVQGIQTTCILSLPSLLNDEQHRITGRREGLVDLMMGAMLRFPQSVSSTLWSSTQS